MTIAEIYLPKSDQDVNAPIEIKECGDENNKPIDFDMSSPKSNATGSSEGGLYMCATNSHNRQFKLKPKDLAGVPQDIINAVDVDGDRHITFNEIIREATKCNEAEHKAAWWRRVVAALVFGVCLTVILNSIGTIISIENTKESLVVNQQMVDPSGKSVRVASSDMGLKVNGQLCPLAASGECSSGMVKTGEARSYASLFDLPVFDSKTLASLRELTLLLQDGQELTLTIVGNMKHKGGKSATFYAASGSRVVIDSISMTAKATVEGQTHVISNPKQRLRRLQEGGQWQPQLYDEWNFFTTEKGFDVVLDAQTGRHLRRRLNANSDHSGWGSLALSIGEAVAGFYENSQGQQIQQYASITGHVTVKSGTDTTELDMAILYNKTMPSHSRLRLAIGGQAWLTAYGQFMEFAYSGGVLQSCEVLSNPAAPQLIQNAVSLVEENGVLKTFAEEDGSTYQITMEISSFEFDNVVNILQVPDVSACPTSSRRLEAPADTGVGGWEYSGNDTLTGRRLADVADSVGWYIAKSTYGIAGWQSALGDRDYSVPNFPYAGWAFKAKNGECTTSHSIAKIVLHEDKVSVAVSFVEFENLYEVVRRAAIRDSTIIGYVQDIISDNEQNLFPCLEKKLPKNRVKFLIGHGIGGAVAVSYFHNQGGRGSGKLTGDAVVVTYGAPPTGPDECDLPGTRHHHANDALGSDMLSTGDHEMEEGKVYDDTSPRRRWKTYERRRISQWEWTDDCERKTSDSFSNVDAVLNFNVYDDFFASSRA